MTTHRFSMRISGMLLFVCLALPLHAQNPSIPSSVPPMQPPVAGAGATGGFGPSSSDPEQAHMLRKMVKERNVLRQRTIVDDTNRLLDLAKQLKEAVDKSNKDQLSLSVVNTASEIEKLARAVKDRMRDGE